MEVYVVHVAPRKGIRCVVKSWLHQPSNARLQLTLLFQINRVHSSREGSKSKQRSRDKCTSAVVWQRLFNASHRTTQATTLTLGKQATFLSSRSAKAHLSFHCLLGRKCASLLLHSPFHIETTTPNTEQITPHSTASSYTYTLHQNYHITHQLLQTNSQLSTPHTRIHIHTPSFLQDTDFPSWHAHQRAVTTTINFTCLLSSYTKPSVIRERDVE
jgi:hypothetical protein